MNKEVLYRFLRQQRYAVVSSIGEAGTPQSALVGIAVTPDLAIIFDTLKSSRKYRNLLRHPACSFVIGLTGEETVQFEGVAQEPCGKALKHIQERYFATWMEGRARMSRPEITHFVVHPSWIRYSDFRVSPPAVTEMTCPGIK